ncbi:hypothetical protein COPEUT_00997 [Coprococcus eutactus ATCC 27759]|nr:hypothetical protein COPEUT_00997 [Coprococcus eutactus ATCC 27759]
MCDSLIRSGQSYTVFLLYGVFAGLLWNCANIGKMRG